MRPTTPSKTPSKTPPTTTKDLLISVTTATATGMATRYLREFERLLAQAGDADPDELLSVSLLIAEVDKAYLLLSRAVERHKQTQPNALRLHRA